MSQELWTINGNLSEAEPKVGTTYQVVDDRSGTFFGRCTEVNRGAAWFEKLAGTSHALLPENQRAKGEKVLCKATQCKLTEEPLPKQQ